MPDSSPVSAWKQEAGWLASIARCLADPNFPTGEHAALRRMDPMAMRGRAIVAVERLFARVEASPHGEDHRRWTLIIHCLALTRGRHDKGAKSGKILAENHYSEERLNRLMAADAEVQFDILPRLARFLAAKGAAIDWLPLAQIALWAGRNENRADRARMKIARDYVRIGSKETAQ